MSEETTLRGLINSFEKVEISKIKSQKSLQEKKSKKKTLKSLWQTNWWSIYVSLFNPRL